MEQPINEHIRVSKRRLKEYECTLSDRDKAILRQIQNCRFIQTDQVGRLHFRRAATPSARLRAATRSLTRLHNLGLVQPLRRRIGGVRAGSSSYVWTLKTAGSAFLDSLDHKAPKPVRPHEPTYIFLKHILATVEVYARLHTMDGVRLQKAELEPVCWRTYTAPYGGRAILKPDLYAVTAVDGYEDHWFFEVDLNTEAPSRVIRKCEIYRNYYLCGEEQRRIGVFPRVVWIAPDDKRRDNLHRHIHEQLNDCEDLFAVITPKDLDTLIRSGAMPVVMGQA